MPILGRLLHWLHEITKPDEGRISRVDFRAKLLAALSVSVAAMLVDIWSLAALSLILAASSILVGKAGRVVRSLFLSIPFVLFYASASSTVYIIIGMGSFILPVLTASLRLLILVEASALLIFGTPTHLVIRGLRGLGLPRTFSMAIAISLRMLQSASLEASTLSEALSVDYGHVKGIRGRLQASKKLAYALTYSTVLTALETAESIYSRRMLS